MTEPTPAELLELAADRLQKPLSPTRPALVAPALVGPLAHWLRSWSGIDLREDGVMAEDAAVALDLARAILAPTAAPHGAPDAPPAPQEPSATKRENGTRARGARTVPGAAQLAAELEPLVRNAEAPAEWVRGADFMLGRVRLAEPGALGEDPDCDCQPTRPLNTPPSGHTADCLSLAEALTPPAGLRDRIIAALATAHREWMRPGSDAGERPMLDHLGAAVLAVVEPEVDDEARDAEHTWSVEMYEPLAQEWVSGTRHRDRARAVAALDYSSQIGPTWRDGTPVQRRLVRATTTYTVEQPATPRRSPGGPDQPPGRTTTTCLEAP